MKPAAQHPDRDRFLNAIFFLALLIFILIAVFVHIYPVNQFDSYIQEQMRPLAVPALLPFWIYLTFLGSFAFLFPAWRHRPSTPLIPSLIDYSFPSGHSTSSFIFCAVLIYSLWHSAVSRSLLIAGISFLMILACSIGLSRIVLNAHYPTDVTAGFCFGALWSTGWYRFIHKKI